MNNQDRLSRMTKTYEAVGTEVRKDLGDSIKKAFRNVPEILKDLGLDTSEENQRAVRILGYNGMEIKAESIAQVKDCDFYVNQTMAKLKPGTVFEMIRHGENPLDMTMKELSDTADQYNGNQWNHQEQESNNYGEFLWELEQTDGITEEERQSFIDTSIEQIKEKLAEANIKADISGRAKHFYSIYKKMKRDNKDLSEIYDLSAVRVLVDSVKDCYGVLGVIHAMWKPIPGRFKDYIAMPKSNGYQSLHTTVMTRGYPLEIQIRTFAMHQVSEFGVAAHWKYKEAGKGAKATGAVDQKMSWLRQMVNLQQELSDPKEYFEALKVDVFSDEVFVFTPKGDVVDLPKGSIPIDFAYRIHTEVGHHCVGAKVNGKLVPLEYKLKNGDIVSVITNKANNGPSRDWLNIVASSETRSKIRSWFKKEKREENIQHGYEMLQDEIKRLGYVPKQVLADDRLTAVAEAVHVANKDDLLASVGFGGTAMPGVLTKLVELEKKEVQKNTPEDVSKLLAEIKAPVSRNNDKKTLKSSHGVLVEGEGGILVHLAKCCNPIPGDPITGFITRGRGVSVHRSDCPNVLKDNDLSRLIGVSWDVGLDKDYVVDIEIVCNDRSGVLAEILAVPSELKMNISSVNANPNHSNKTSTVLLGIQVRNADQVQQLMNRLRRVKDVFSVARAMGRHAGN